MLELILPSLIALLKIEFRTLVGMLELPCEEHFCALGAQFRTLVGMLELQIRPYMISTTRLVSNPCRYAGTRISFETPNFSYRLFRTLVGMLELSRPIQAAE